MSQVEHYSENESFSSFQFWDKIKLHFGDTRAWDELNPMEQKRDTLFERSRHTFIQGINSILSVFIK